ncbi:hypothetical protein [Roseicyclus amphidinii]|uniref:hypothetical protein n=1 Tax=Roseicyclus amphidinii TaxID=3034232 RepID=UPI0024E1712E|nr:hypothetical protein [Roseicyclus sp. Amp-Y-6]
MSGPRKWTRSAVRALVVALGLGSAAAGAALANGGAVDASGAGPEAIAESGPAIRAALLAHDVIYPGIGWERHEPNGRILSRSLEGPYGRTSVGEWRMEGALRCLRWTRAAAWVCYRVEIEGETLRFIDPLGNVSAGRLQPR